MEVKAIVADMLTAHRQIGRLALIERLSRTIPGGASEKSLELARHAYAVQGFELIRLRGQLIAVKAANDEEPELPGAA